MGALCATPPSVEDAKNKEIEKEQIKTMRKNEQVVKLLLLGAGESGKSTIFKQMKFLFGRPYDQDELKNLIPIVHNNILQNLILVLEASQTKDIPFEDQESFKAFLGDYTEDSPIDAPVADLVRKLWRDPACKKLWEIRNSFQVLDSLSYYCADENITRIAKPGYLPNKMDILQARVRTSGIVEDKYLIDDVEFVLFDVGGQRNERKKWIHCFDGVTAVIFVTAISEYDQVLYEDNKTKRVDEAIKLFDEICNSPWFTKTSVILFLNKVDLFEAKLFKVPYRIPGERNDDFAGPYAGAVGTDPKEAVAAAIEHVLSKFLAVKRDEKKEVYHHVTCATDSQNVQVVFNACKDTILRKNLVGAGFMQ